jgi:hypothetical protein
MCASDATLISELDATPPAPLALAVEDCFSRMRSHAFVVEGVASSGHLVGVSGWRVVSSGHSRSAAYNRFSHMIALDGGGTIQQLTLLEAADAAPGALDD